MINFDDLDLAIDHCRREDLAPYDQRVWGELDKKSNCATGACLAGTYVLMKGYRFVQDLSPALYYCADAQGHQFNIAKLAAEALGLTEAQALELFASENDLDVIEHMAKYLRNHPDAGGDDLYELREQILEARDD